MVIERFLGEHREMEEHGGESINIFSKSSPLSSVSLCPPWRRNPVYRFVSLGKRTFPRRTQRNGGARRGNLICICIINPLHSPLNLCVSLSVSLSKSIPQFDIGAPCATLWRFLSHWDCISLILPKGSARFRPPIET